MKLNLKSNFVKSLAVLASGSIFAQLIVIIASPIMTRLYSPEQIGAYTLVLTAIGLFGSVICARYDMAIVSETDEDNVVKLCCLSGLITVLLSFIVSIGYSIYYHFQGYTSSQIVFSCICIFILLILQGINNVLLSYNNRKREYRLMTSVNLIRSVAKEAIMIIGGLIKPSSLLLVISEIVGTIFGVRRQSKSLRESTNNFRSIKIDNFDLRFVAKKHKRQALYSTPALFANNFSYSSINLFINSLFGTAILGFYSVSYRLLGLPLSIISSNVSKVYFEEASRDEESKGSYTPLFFRTAFLLLLAAIPITALLMLFSPWFCSLFFGKDYYIAGVYLRYLAPMFGIRFIVSPLSVGMIVSQKQQYDFLFQLLFVIMSVAAFGVTSTFKLSIEQYLLLISCLYSVVYIIFFVVLYSFSRGNNNQNN